ncbi:hypothetical protein [Lysobacter soli]|jgi:hypothetical protein|uniref:Uncharacterized protein n=1 Tax=Lysobacter soli TaxID=453783 RepID=A0A3D8VCA9_9GAMM|nr:hypothetical protein [Lysobacter soli]QGW65904.1 hypothetical protein GOY17_13895 [Lysobacter soli]RDY67054.1 hypothetical protein DX912_10270 [Lysobacter soli]
MEKSAERNALWQERLAVGFDVVNREGILQGYACNAPFVIGAFADEPARESAFVGREALALS